VKRLALALALGALTCCHRAGESPAASEPASSSPAGVPVQISAVSRADLAETVSGTGHVVALVEQKIRAPFVGTLAELDVVDGDRVRKGQTLGVIVSRDSEAALLGAEQMVREAQTEAERTDADRALALARASLIRSSLKSPSEGVVLSHAASAGDRVAEDQEILSISAVDSLVFEADVSQADLPRVHPGQKAQVTLPGGAPAVEGVVHDVLASANTADFTVPVRIDLKKSFARFPVGLFGEARITVGERRGVPVVPPQAVLRNDVTGESRVATVTADGKAHWLEVRTGLADLTHIEIVSPVLAPGTHVVVSGQVGLPEGAPVSVQQ
jgi:multidrug efflux pump subunit AcrA (membrane-fusion protein)